MYIPSSSGLVSSSRRKLYTHHNLIEKSLLFDTKHFVPSEHILDIQWSSLAKITASAVKIVFLGSRNESSSLFGTDPLIQVCEKCFFSRVLFFKKDPSVLFDPYKMTQD